MNGIKIEWVVWGVGAGVALLALNAFLSGRLLSSTAGAVARAPVDIFIGGTEGLTGLPDPRKAESISRCQQAKAAGNDWEASFYCPAASTIEGWFDKEWF